MVLKFYSLQALITAIVSLIVGFFVFNKDKQNLAHRTFALWTLSVAIWAFGISRHALANNAVSGLVWSRILHGAAIFIPTFFLHFTLAILNIKNKKSIIQLSYLCSIILFAFNFTKFFIPSVRPILNFKYFPTPGPIYPLFVLMFVACVIYSLKHMMDIMRVSSGTRRNQIRYLFLGAAIGFSGGSSTFFPIFNIKIFPIGNFFIVFYISLIAYAITRHHLMDIEVLIKKTVVFASLMAFVFSIFIAVAYLVGQLFGAGRLLSYFVTSLIIVIFHRPLETWLINTTDKFLFQKKYEYKQIIKIFLGEVITKLNIDEVVNSTSDILEQTLHPYSTAIFILNKVEDKYQLYGSRGIENKDISFTSDSKLVTFLKNTKSPAIIKNIGGIVGVSPEIAFEVAKLNAVLVLPLMLHNDLIGFIALGRKKSDEEYTKEDLDILLDLAHAETIAIANSLLLIEAAQAEKQAAIGTMASGIHHEIGNPLNIINTQIQLFLLKIQRGLFKNKSKEEIIQECKNILNETIKQASRISKITKQLGSFAKPSKDMKPELLNIPEQIDETLQVIGHELELERVSIEKQIAPELPQILADRSQIEQVLFNLIKNAGQAIEGTGKIIIKAFTTDSGKVRIEIIDSGKGIPEDKAHRIFEPFFSTKGTKGGTGLGLYIVRQLVWRNKGEISMKSKVGEGTTFILEFPKAG